MQQPRLNYFTHSTDGKVYGAWYRVLSNGGLEVLAVGLIHTLPVSGPHPETTAQAVLAEFLQRSSQNGVAIPALGEMATLAASSAAQGSSALAKSE
jgi:hypothetical protein